MPARPSFGASSSSHWMELSPAVRDAMRLRVVDELAYPALAARLGTTEPAARARVSRGLAALADALDGPTIRMALQP